LRLRNADSIWNQCPVCEEKPPRQVKPWQRTRYVMSCLAKHVHERMGLQ
jgi:hypothetical protein